MSDSEAFLDRSMLVVWGIRSLRRGKGMLGSAEVSASGIMGGSII